MKDLLVWASAHYDGKKGLIAHLNEKFDRNYAEVMLNRWISGKESTPRHVADYLRVKRLDEELPYTAETIINKLCLE